MKFYLNGKKITKKVAMTYISKEQLEEAKQDFYQDPYEEQSWYTRDGYLVVEF